METVPLHCAVFRSSVCLRFFFGGFFGTNFGVGVWGFLGRFFGPKKCPSCVPKTAKNEVLPFLGFFRSSILLWHVFVEGFGQRTPCFVLAVFLCDSGCAFLYEFTYVNQGSLVFSPLSGLWGRCFGVLLCSLCPGRPPSPSCFLLLSLSPSLSSLSCMHELLSVNPPNCPERLGHLGRVHCEGDRLL